MDVDIHPEPNVVTKPSKPLGGTIVTMRTAVYSIRIITPISVNVLGNLAIAVETNGCTNYGCGKIMELLMSAPIRPITSLGEEQLNEIIFDTNVGSVRSSGNSWYSWTTWLERKD